MTILHEIVPWPVGRYEGDPVLRLSGAEPPADPLALREELEAAHAERAITWIWCDLALLVGPAGRALTNELRTLWTPVVLARVGDKAWPTWPGLAVVLDVTPLMAQPITDPASWTIHAASQVAGMPTPIEIFAIRPHPAAVAASALADLGQLLQVRHATLYVDPEQVPAAVAASARIRRPWAVRRAPAPAASPAR